MEHDNDVDDILSQLKTHKKKYDEETTSVNLTADGVQDFLIQKTGELVQEAISAMQSVNRAIANSTDAKEIAAMAEVIKAASAAVGTLTTLHTASEKNKVTREMKQLDIESREKMNTEDNQTRVMLNREEILKYITNPDNANPRIAKGSVIDSDSEDEE